MTEVSLNFRQEAYAAETGRVLIALMTITHDDLAEPIRISSDPTERIAEYTTDAEVVYGTVSRSENYIFFPIRIKLPDDTDDGPGEMTIELDNIHRQYIETIRTILSPAKFKVEIVMDDSLDVVEASWPEFLLTNVRYDASIITGTLKLELLEREPFPAGSFSPSYFPALF